MIEIAYTRNGEHSPFGTPDGFRRSSHIDFVGFPGDALVAIGRVEADPVSDLDEINAGGVEFATDRDRLLAIEAEIDHIGPIAQRRIEKHHGRGSLVILFAGLIVELAGGCNLCRRPIVRKPTRERM